MQAAAAFDETWFADGPPSAPGQSGVHRIAPRAAPRWTTLSAVGVTPAEQGPPRSSRSSQEPPQPRASITSPSADESGALVARARDGDRAAFRALFERHRGDVARLVYRMVGPRAELEDLVQEVFVQVHRSLRDFRGDARFSTWLHRVTVNVVLMHRRAEKSRPILSEELPTGSVEDLGTVRPDDEADRRTRIGAFFEVLAQISEKKRVVFILHDLEGMAPTEIAKVVEAPVLTVRTRLFYARRELEEKMRGHVALASIVEAQGGFAGDGDAANADEEATAGKRAKRTSGGTP